MKVYIATTLTNADAHNRLRDQLLPRGHELTFDWTHDIPVWQGGTEALASTARNEINGVRDADVVVVLMPGGRGTHVELGAALALGKLVVMFAASSDYEANSKTCAFYHHPSVSRWVEDNAVHQARIVESLFRNASALSQAPEHPKGEDS